MNDLLANSNVLQLAAGVCCVIISIGIAGGMMISAARRDLNTKKVEDSDGR